MTKTRTLLGFGICALMALTTMWIVEEAVGGQDLGVSSDFRFIMASSDAMEYLQENDSVDEIEATPIDQPSPSGTIQGSLALLSLAGIALMRGSK